MACCLLESLVRCRGFDPVDQLARYRRWYAEGYYSPLGRCFDIGNTTRRGVDRDDTERTPLLPLHRASELVRGGNGSIMRAAPLTVALLGCTDPAVRAWVCAAQARTTHSEHTSVQCAFLLQEICRALLLGEPKASVLAPGRFASVMRDAAVAAVPGMSPLTPYVEAIIAGRYAHKLAPWEEPPTRAADAGSSGTAAAAGGSSRRDHEVAYAGYLADECLDAALWAFARTDTFVDGATAAVNLGDDSDTVGAVYGNIAGCAYGLCTIDPGTATASRPAASASGSSDASGGTCSDLDVLQRLLGIVGSGGRPRAGSRGAALPVEGATVPAADLLARLSAAGIAGVKPLDHTHSDRARTGSSASVSGLPLPWATLVWRHADIACMAAELFLAATAATTPTTATSCAASAMDGAAAVAPAGAAEHREVPPCLLSGSLLMGWRVPEAIVRSAAARAAALAPAGGAGSGSACGT